MKLVIVEVEQNKWNTVYNINLNNNCEIIWEDGLKEYEISEDLLLEIKQKEVVGWIDGTNRFNKQVKRTYMLVE